ncbi:MAG: tryptophan-rich sensory protein [Candidatus Binatia bacterium]|nr:tryptophan-rich sensory protein [Candidatus Binatia bacterium]
MPVQRPIRTQLAALLVLLVLCFAAAGVASLLTASSVSGWYQTLAKPSWTPPDWVFRPVWSVLYLMMAVAAWVVWRTEGPRRREALTLFGVQLGLNVAWSGCFFALQRPGLALLTLLVLLAVLTATTHAFWRLSRFAAALLLPYLLWSAFAAILNSAIWWLNR